MTDIIQNVGIFVLALGSIFTSRTVNRLLERIERLERR